MTLGQLKRLLTRNRVGVSGKGNPHPIRRGTRPPSRILLSVALLVLPMPKTHAQTPLTYNWTNTAGGAFAYMVSALVTATASAC